MSWKTRWVAVTASHWSCAPTEFRLPASVGTLLLPPFHTVPAPRPEPIRHHSDLEADLRDTVRDAALTCVFLSDASIAIAIAPLSPFA